MTDPKLIMLDEPMAGVNPALKQSLLNHIHQLKSEGRTVLFVEHDMDMVHEISDWVLVMAEGRLIAEGTAAQISGNQSVIDAYLGAHHEVDLGSMDEAEAIEQLGLDAEELGVDTIHQIVETHHESEWGVEETKHMMVLEQAQVTSVIEATDLVAGYVPEVNILNGCNLTVRAGRVRRHHRTQWGWQVDVPQGGSRSRQRSFGRRTVPW